jgi:putative SOS response-associated peptidase YedK
MAEIHNVKQRMPAILAVDDIEAWLAGSAGDAHAALKPYPADSMVAWPVSRSVNTPKNNHEGLIEPAPPLPQAGDADASTERAPLDPGQFVLE